MWNFYDHGNVTGMELIESCEYDNPDHAAMAIIEMAWTALQVSNTQSFVGLTARRRENPDGYRWRLYQWRRLQSDALSLPLDRQRYL